MLKKNRLTLLSTSIMVAFSATSALAEEAALSAKDYDATIMERVMVIGNAERAKEIAGSAHYIGEEELEKNNYSDIGRVLRQVPGVNIQEEEGYGNRPNIGLRGGRSERSADITLMEDGILIAPAPYASPSAYYFPRVSRMEGVEVRKGSSTVKFGPRTTSGAVNLISSSVPAKQKGKALVGYGTDNNERVQLNYGNSHGNFGYVFDFGHEATDGFKSLDIVGGDTGYSIQDVMGKFKVQSDPSAKYYQSFELKVGATEEDSDETYLGLSDADFGANPYRRYASTQIDNMDAEHRQYHLRHYIDLEFLDVTTTLYRNEYARNWYKLQDVTVGGSTQNLSNAFDSATHLNALKGLTDLDGSAANNLRVRANNREYYSQGLQSDVSTELSWGPTTHKVETGFRAHYDEEDRFQQQDRYSITNGVMTLSDAGAPGSNANRRARAKAGALYLTDEIKYDQWTFSPGVRYEHIILERINRTSGVAEENTVDAIVPGLGVSYAVNSDLSVFGGVHKGFAPPSPGSTNEEEEESINYEIGARYNLNGLSTELVGFYNDYKNLLGDCTLSSGCTSGNLGDQFNAGEVEVMGIEAAASYDVAKHFNIGEISLPVGFNYTYTQAEFDSSFTSSFDEWGTVTAGDELPYIPEHQFFLTAGIVHPKWEINAAGKFVDEMRTQAGSGSIQSGQGTDAHFVVDLAGEYEVYDQTRAFVNIENLFDETYVAARRPAGARPGKPLTFLAGVKYEF